tara:strand:- start:276 stop:1550 length:1275 start_codon:yes stop_codon:yes gene_type:complete
LNLRRNKLFFRDYSFWILFVVLFSTGYVFFKSPFEFYFHYIFLFPLTAFFILKFGIPRFYFKLFAIPLLLGLVHVALDNNDFFTFFKIFVGLSISTLFFFFILHIYDFNNFKVFKIYCNACWILCIFAIVQIFSFFIEFQPGYNFSWFLNKWGFVRGGIIGFRVNSILPEPTYLATSLSPVVYISIRNLIHKNNFIFSKYQSIIIIIISILTTSTIGYLGIIISIILSLDFLRLRYFLFVIVIFVAGFMTAYNNVSDFSNRVNSAKGLWLDKDFTIGNTNNSSFVLYNNLHIAKENLQKFPIFGTGLGSHETAFKNFTLTRSLIQYDFEFNIKDGNSLFVRLCTETGLLGLVFIFIIIINGFIYNSEPNDDLVENKIISHALFILIVLVLVRQGNYMLNGLPLIFLIYHFNKISFNEKITHLNE